MPINKGKNRHSWLWLMFPLSLVVLFSTGCRAPVTSPSESGDSVKRDLAIVSPKEGETVKGASVTVEIKLKNVTLTNPTGVNNPQEGHLHVYLKSEGKEKAINTIQNVVEFSDVTPGRYTITADVAQNDHSAFNPPLKKNVTFTVSP